MEPEKYDELSNNIDKLIKAIKTRVVVSFRYSDDKIVVEPYTLGIHTGTGKHVLRCYRSMPFEQSDMEESWETYEVSRIENLKLTETKAKKIRFGYDASHLEMSHVLASVTNENE
jgi:hypothetical protein